MDLVDRVSTQFNARQYMGQHLFDLPSMAQILEHVRGLARTRGIRVVANGKRVYDLDLEQSHRFLAATRTELPSLDAVQSFVDAQVEKPIWRRCVVVGNGSGSRSRPSPAEEQLDPLRTLALFDDVLPGRVTYKLVYKYNGAEEDVWPDTAGNRLTLAIANLLTLIFGRQIEHAAFKSLHKSFAKHHQYTSDDMDQLAGRLFALRWRVALCKRRPQDLLFAGPSSDATEMARLSELCRKLYFCFCCVRQKRQNHATLRNELGRDERTHFHAGARHAVTERVPEVYSNAGFEQWMRDGEALVQQADLVEV